MIIVRLMTKFTGDVKCLQCRNRFRDVKSPLRQVLEVYSVSKCQNIKIKNTSRKKLLS